MFRGTQGATPITPDVGLTTLVPLSGTSCNLANAAPGTPLSITTTGEPALSSAHYYLIGHNPSVPGGQAALGRRGDGSLRPLAPVCP